MNIRTDLPDGSRSGEEGTWELPTVIEDDPHVRDGVLVIDAKFLGGGNSRQRRHGDHLGVFAGEGERCGVCRWFETRIFQLGPSEYVLHHVGRSIVPGEDDICRHERGYSALEVIELYTIRNPGENPFITRPAARALAQAAGHDDDLRDAYENRAVI